LGCLSGSIVDLSCVCHSALKTLFSFCTPLTSCSTKHTGCDSTSVTFERGVSTTQDESSKFSRNESFCPCGKYHRLMATRLKDKSISGEQRMSLQNYFKHSISKTGHLPTWLPAPTRTHPDPKPGKLILSDLMEGTPIGKGKHLGR